MTLVPAESKRERKSSHLDYLEGLRGIAALVVVMNHVVLHTVFSYSLSGWSEQIANGLAWVFQGRPSVAMFIVLSGYVLMRPVLKAGDTRWSCGPLVFALKAK